MRILVTGATGYIGKRLIPALLREGHQVIAMVRDKDRFHIVPESYMKEVELVEADLLNPEEAEELPLDIDAAYYLVHSMSSSRKSFMQMEADSAKNFLKLVEKVNLKQIIYLSGISNEENLSTHLESRLQVERILGTGKTPVITFRAGIIVGSGSASFEIIRDLMEKLPILIAPRWLKTRSQPLAIRDLISFFTKILLYPETENTAYDIGGPEILSYRQMLLIYAEVRKLKRKIITFPLISPGFSSYWLSFITSTNWDLARNLVDSLKVDVICKPNNLAEKLGIEPISYKKAIELAFQKIAQNEVVSSWKDSFSGKKVKKKVQDHITVPEFGVIKDSRKILISGDPDLVYRNFMSIGGERGWYHATWLWKLRGDFDALLGGVGIRRGRTRQHKLEPGDSLDFFRVLAADKKKKRLLLYAEIISPGDTWLEFFIKEENGKHYLHQIATFRPHGVGGRLYIYILTPFHKFILGGLIKKIERFRDPS